MDTSELTQTRIARNQSTFREANERIEVAADDMNLADPVPFICECADRGCVEIVRLQLDAYEDVRRHPRRFFNAPGHERLSLDSGAAVIVEEFPSYLVLEKIGRAGEVAEAHDERDRDR